MNFDFFIFICIPSLDLLLEITEIISPSEVYVPILFLNYSLFPVLFLFYSIFLYFRTRSTPIRISNVFVNIYIYLFQIRQII